MKIVIKLGGSVLHDKWAYILQADNINNIMSRYNPTQAYVVVSAMKGRTDDAIGRVCGSFADESRLRGALKGEEYYERFDTSEIAGILLQPEIDSAKHLGDLLGAYVLDQDNSQFPIVANGSYLYGCIDIMLSEQQAPILDNLGKIVVVSGFGAVNPDGDKVLLGRNASDLVAAMIARLVRADMLMYCKDVESIYNDCKDRISFIDTAKTDMALYSEVLFPDASEVLSGTSIRVILGHYNDLEHMVAGRDVGTNLSVD